jgi:hypothetical protein
MSPEARERSFDELARGLANGSISRRKALRLMGGLLLGGTLGSLGIGGIAAADDECKPTGRKCRKNHQCCSRICRGTCQEQTTTTTAAPTTTTTTTTPTTTTTSTTTTPRPCTTDTDCVGNELCAEDGTCQCPGCRDTNGVCQAGFSTSACGSGGGACAQCQPLEFCAGICRCSGCYDAQGVCQSGGTNEACGFGGGLPVPCDVCVAGEVCAGGFCVPQV